MRVSELEQEVERLTHRVEALKQQRDRLAGGTESGNRFDDLFRELKNKEEEAAASGQSAKLLEDLGR